MLMHELLGPHQLAFRALRQLAGTQQALADAAGVDQPRIAKAEGGAHPLTREQWRAAAAHLALGEPSDGESSVRWLLACQSPDHPAAFVALYDEHGRVGAFFDADSAWNAAESLAATRIVPRPFALPCWRAYVLSVAQAVSGQPDGYFQVDEPGDDPRSGQEALARGARTAVYAASVMVMLAQATEVAKARAAT